MEQLGNILASSISDCKGSSIVVMKNNLRYNVVSSLNFTISGTLFWNIYIYTYRCSKHYLTKILIQLMLNINHFNFWWINVIINEQRMPTQKPMFSFKILCFFWVWHESFPIPMYSCSPTADDQFITTFSWILLSSFGRVLVVIICYKV